MPTKPIDNRVVGCLHRCPSCGFVANQVLDDDGNLTLLTKLCGECGIVMFKQIIWADSNIEKVGKPQTPQSSNDFFKDGGFFAV